MAIFLHELRINWRSALIWGLTLSLAVILLLPVFSSLMRDPEAYNFSEFLSSMGDSAYFEAFGVNLESMKTLVGAYAYINMFVSVGCAVFGAKLGTSLFSTECINNTSDFLLTKPNSRTKIFFSKLLAAVLCCFITSALYITVSFIAATVNAWDTFDYLPIALLSFSCLIIMLLFLVLGIFIATINPRVKMPVVIGLALAFPTYIISSLSRLTDSELLIWLSPYNYFDSEYIMQYNHYDYKFFIAIGLLIITSIIGGWIIYKKKDVATAR